MINKKLQGSNIVECIPQSGRCSYNCPCCFFNAFYEDYNLPVLPDADEVNAKGHIVRVNTVHDSNLYRSGVIDATTKYKHKFYNTSMSMIRNFPSAVVLTVNPRPEVEFFIDADYVHNLMFVRIRHGDVSTVPIVRRLIDHYRHLSIPIVLTFNRYLTKIVSDNYERRRYIKHTWWELTKEAKLNVMRAYTGMGIWVCGTLTSNLCVDCRNCEDLYWRWLTKNNGGSHD